MRRAAATVALVVGVLLILGVTAGMKANASVPASWPMFLSDPQHTGRSPYIGPDTPVLKWRVKENEGNFSHQSAALGPDGSIYVGSVLYLTAYDPQGAI